MPRSVWKGPFVHESIVRKLVRHDRQLASGEVSADRPLIVRTWSRASMILPRMVGVLFEVHNGRNFIRVNVTSDKVGHKLGEFAPTRKFVKHPGQKISSRVRRNA